MDNNDNENQQQDWANVDQVQERENAAVTFNTNPANPFKCDQCGFVGISQQSLKIHQFRMHTVKGQAAARAAVHNFRGGKKKRYTCRSCPRSFASQSGLRYHTKTYHGVAYTDLGTELCPECGYMSNEAGVSLHRRLKHGVAGRYSKETVMRLPNIPIAPQIAVATHQHNEINFCPNCGENLQGYRK